MNLKYQHNVLCHSLDFFFSYCCILFLLDLKRRIFNEIRQLFYKQLADLVFSLLTQK